ncbi:MAG: DUF1453 family protein [Sphingobium sp.]|nr:DUF1453 family protein [Sphingobium sp.]
MNQGPVPLWLWGVIGLVLLVSAWRWWRSPREKEVRAHRLWIMPTMMTALILPLLYLQPHRPFGMVDYAIFAVALLLGMTTGGIRAYATTLRYDHEGERLMAGFSFSALILLLPVGLARYISRTYLGIGPEAVHHGDARAISGSLLFVLAMLVAHRAFLYRRAKHTLHSAGQAVKPFSLRKTPAEKD